MSQQIAKRNENLVVKQKLLIEVDPEIADAFHNSVNISGKYQVSNRKE